MLYPFTEHVQYEASGLIISGHGDAGLRQSFCRAFKHNDMRKAAQAFADAKDKAVKLSGGVAPQLELVGVPKAFVDLQQARHEADYDLSKRFTRTEVKDLIDQVTTHSRHGPWYVDRAKVRPSSLVF